MKVGLISDTHGLLRAEAVAALQGCALLIHAGDIGSREVLDALAGMAPVHAVRGNNDKGEWARELPFTLSLPLHGVVVQVLHDLKDWPSHRDADARVVIAGHSHKPLVERRGEVLCVNPGSAGPRRFSLPVSVGLLHLGAGDPRAEIVRLL